MVSLITKMVLGAAGIFGGLVMLVLGPVVTTSTAEIGKDVVTNVNSAASTTGIDDVNTTAINTFKMFATFLMLAGIVTIGEGFYSAYKAGKR